MIFRQWQQVLDGTKIQTRRLTKRGQQLTPNRLHTEHTWPFPPTVLENTQIKWMVGKIYAVQPGRGKKGVGYFRITGIRCERVRDITPEDCRKEGLDPVQRVSDRTTLIPDPDLADIILRLQFHKLWNSINKKSGTRWEDNPEVWVLEFEVVNENTT